MRQSAGTVIEVAETVHTHEIIISAVEAAKRVKAECGQLPDGFIDSLRRQYPEGVPARAVNDLIKERRPKNDNAINKYGNLVSAGWVTEGGAPADSGTTPAEQTISKTA
jgi:hypothetical protein